MRQGWWTVGLAVGWLTAGLALAQGGDSLEVVVKRHVTVTPVDGSPCQLVPGGKLETGTYNTDAEKIAQLYRRSQHAPAGECPEGAKVALTVAELQQAVD